MYEDDTYRREYFDSRFGRVSFIPPDFGWFDALVLAAFLLGLFAVCCLSGCAGGAAGAGGHAAAVAASVGAKPGSIGAGAAVALDNASSGSGWLYALGGFCLIGGGVCLGHPQGPNGLGFGLLVAGACLLLAGAVLPLLAGWLGLGFLALLVALFLAQKAGLFDRLKTLLPQPVTK